MKKLLIATALLFSALPFTFDGVTPTVSKADARIGRPLTPLSVAGVHRRAVRRTFGVGANLGYHPVARAAAVGAVAAGAGYYGGGYGYGAPSYGADYEGGYGYGDGTYGYGYADYAAPAYDGYRAVAPVTGGSTVIIVTAPVAPGYATQPIYDYAPGYGYGYTPGYWNRGYWGRWNAGWWR